MRIYHNVTTTQVDELAFLCNLHCTHSYLDLCDIRTVPALAAHKDLETTIDMGRAWRFVVLGDPTVRFFGVRDLDSFLLQRERDVVTEWVRKGDKQFYIMRDTPIGRNSAGYLMPIKGSCWGGNNYADFPLARRLVMDVTTTRHQFEFLDKIIILIFPSNYVGIFIKFKLMKAGLLLNGQSGMSMEKITSQVILTWCT